MMAGIEKKEGVFRGKKMAATDLKDSGLGSPRDIRIFAREVFVDKDLPKEVFPPADENCGEGGLAPDTPPEPATQTRAEIVPIAKKRGDKKGHKRTAAGEDESGEGGESPSTGALGLYKYNKNGEVVMINTGNYAEHLATSVKAVCINRDFYFYEDGFYRRKTDDEVLSYIHKGLDKSACKFSTVEDILRQWRIDARVTVAPDRMNGDPHLLNLRNGIFDLRTGTLSPHTPDALQSVRIEASYKEGLLEDEEQGKFFRGFLKKSVPDEGVQAVVQEMFGYCLTGFTQAQKFFVLDGVARSGKSTLIKLLESMIDHENISHVRLQDLHGFFISELHNKVLNTFADLDGRAIPDMSTVKALTGEDYIMGDRKHKNPIQFKNKAKMLFSTNGMPRNYADKSEGFYRRLIVIPFYTPVQESESNAFLDDALKEERDYVLMWALEGLKRLLQRSFVFSESALVLASVTGYRESNNTVIQFVNDICTLNPEKRILKKWLFDVYLKYCKEDLNVRAMGRNGFYKELEEKYGIKEDTVRLDGQRTLAGITI